MLVIFGLRGLKHEMESQIALKCAKECYESLVQIEHMLGVGAAVTTGNVYLVDRYTLAIFGNIGCIDPAELIKSGYIDPISHFILGWWIRLNKIS